MENTGDRVISWNSCSGRINTEADHIIRHRYQTGVDVHTGDGCRSPRAIKPDAMNRVTAQRRSRGAAIKEATHNMNQISGGDAVG